MALVQTPEGIPMYVPDNLAPLQGSTEYPGGQIAGAMIPTTFQPPPPPVMQIPGPAPSSQTNARPQPRTDAARVGQVAEDAPPEVAGAPAAGATSSPATPALPVQSSADFAVSVETDPKVLAAKAKAAQKQQAAQEKAQAQQAAFNASPEGQAQIAGRDAISAKQAEGQIALDQGAIEAKEIGEARAMEQAGFDRAEQVRADAAAEQAARAAGLAEKQKAFDSAVRTEAEYKIDDNRRYKNLGTGKTVLFWISAALSGLGDALMKRSGPNMPLQMLQQAIEQDVAAQVREREQLGKRIGIQRNSIENYRQITGDMADAAKLKLSEEYDRTAQQVRLVAAKYGSDKAKLRAETMAVQLEGQAAQIRAGTAEAAFGRDVQRQQLANARAQIGISAGNLALNRKQFEWTKEMQGKQLQIEAAKLDQAGNTKGAEDVRKFGVPLPPVAVLDENGKPTGETRAGGALVLTNATEKEAEALREKVVQSNRVIDITDELRQIVAETSGAGRKFSDWTGSPQAKRMQVLKEEIVGLRKSGTTGMSSDADMARLERAAGVNSLTDLRGAAAALDEAREQTIKGLHTAIRGRGGDPSSFVYADPLANRPVQTAEDAAFKESLKSNTGFGAAQTFLEEGRPAFGSPYQVDLAAREEFARSGTTKSQRTLVQSLVDRSTDPKLSQAQRDAAMSRLRAGAQQGGDANVKALYQSALDAVTPSPITTSGETLEPTVR